MDKIKFNGVIYTMDNNVCVDIDIPPNTNTLTLGPDISGLSFKLRGVFKQFPNITKLVITANVLDIEISNFMFPNVKEVESKNIHYLSDRSLIKCMGYGIYVLNAFCKDGPITNDHRAYEICDYALEGNRSREFFVKFTKNPNSFAGFLIMPPKDGLYMIGTSIFKFAEDSDEIVIPPDAESCMEYTNLKILPKNQKFKKITITKPEQIPLLPHEDVIETLNIQDFQMNFYNLRSMKIENFQVSDDSPYYKAIDGVLFSRDEKKLLLFPSARTGHYQVPEGTKVIEECAFMHGNISSVAFPDSLVRLRERAFADSAIEHIDFGNGLKQIGSVNDGGIFTRCKNLKDLEIPGTISTIAARSFKSSKLKKVILNEGLLDIGSEAFNATDLQTIKLPSSIISLGFHCFWGIPEVVLSEEIPDNILQTTVCAVDNLSISQDFVTLYHGSDKLILPIFMHMPDLKRINPQNMFGKQEEILSDIDMNPELKQNLILKFWDQIKDPEKRAEYGECLRKAQTKLCTRLVNENREQDLVKFLKTGCYSDSFIKNVMGKIPENMVSARSYVLSLKKSKKSKYSL